MSTSSLEHKTIRPGSLAGYSYYHSDRHPGMVVAPAPVPVNPVRQKLQFRLLALVLVVAAATFAVPRFISNDSGNSATPQITSKTAPAVTATSSNHCAGNALDHFILISITQRHLWACQGAKTVYDSAVITGLRNHPETETPVGSYHIYGKITNTTLTGADSRGSWSDPVYYWMPFLDNQYGTYGFHDATWRPDTAFGKVSPDSTDASHGCVELPLASSKWLYEWAPIGTTVTVKS